MSKQYNELRRLIKECCEEATAAGALALKGVRRMDKVLASLENLRGRLAVQEELLRQLARTASGRPQR